ncbi:flagellar hook-associated protein FlgK [Ramlibacter sp. H39-3-26]|uniref:flagellar hook-associated protein FlgK n=1 Tax=Curvibacter soli TaxID=3031331 RepID=UPI0023DB2386|nr:flagellar hook-associated protein FlgK [Ramlibacter sp. H39-3-26]MDF1485809.1 flagellar hook-associated protein FlgK [Ramlibacter sp. H39-3-26]
MSTLLNLGARALLANTAALQTIGHNISNANTAGYSVQSVVLATVAGQYTGSGYIGSGVEATTVKRSYSEFLTRQAALTQSIASMDQARSDKLSQLQDIFQAGDSGLGAAVNSLLNAFSDLTSAPTDLTARNVVLTRANELASMFQSAAAQIADTQSGVTQELQNSVSAINTLASQIAAVNEQIARVTGNGQTPNDLLDQRDQLINDLNQYVQTSTVPADDGTLSVFVGSQALVLGNTAAQMALVADGYGNPNAQLAVQRGSVSNVLDENALGGGSVAGLLKFQHSDLPEATNLLGRMALTITEEVNAQHHIGLTLDGTLGGDFFTPQALANGLAASANTGTASVSMSVADTSMLVASDYQVVMTGAASGSVVRKSDGQAFAFTAVPVQVDGLQFSVSAGAAAGDSFLVQPYANTASGMGTVFSSPRDLAVASTIEPQIGAANTGSMTVTALQAHAGGFVMPPVGGVALTFAAGPPLTYTLTGSTTPPSGFTGNYLSGQTITIDGWDLTLQGTPATGDTVTVQDARPASGGTGYYTLNAGNASALMGLRDKAVFDGSPLSDGYAGLIAQLGTRTQSAQYATTVSQTIAANTESSRAAISGVNLDEEAAKLIQFQQAYQASSKLIQVSQSIFDSLIQTLR